MSLPRLSIIGGGVCGGTIARLLSPHFSTTVFEKSGRLSGRCASLLFRDAVLDHGAPYFALCPATRSFLNSVLGPDLLPLPGRVIVVDGTGAETKASTTEPQDELFVRESGNSLCARLLGGVPHVSVRTRETVVRDTDSNLLTTADGARLPEADATVVTAPLPQAAALFPHVLSAPSVAEAYAPALMAAVAYSAGSAPSDGVYARRFVQDNALSFATRESLKPRAAREDLFLVRATEAFSRARLEDNPLECADALRAQLETHWPGLRGAECTAVFPKRWRYAEVLPQFPSSPAAADVRRAIADAQRERLYIAGDALGMSGSLPIFNAGVRAAVLSGASTAAAIASTFGVPLNGAARQLLRGLDGAS